LGCSGNPQSALYQPGMFGWLRLSNNRGMSPRMSPSADWNRPYKKQTVCVPLAPGTKKNVPVLYPDGKAVGSGYVVPCEPEWNVRSTEHDLCTDNPGCVRVDLTESIPRGPGAPDLYFHKGGQGYAPPGTAAYGHVPADVFADPPPPRFTKERIDEQGADPGRNPLPGAGRAHPRDLESYAVRPLPIGGNDDDVWLYKAGRAGAKYSKYGDAGAAQGDHSRHFAYLSWSWVRQDGENERDAATVPGGGAVRALLGDGQVVHRCAVESVTTPAWSLDGRVVGRVRAIYVRVPAGDTDLFGWIVHSHLIPTGKKDEEVVPHLERIS
jgi:hypothetical protein